MKEFSITSKCCNAKAVWRQDREGALINEAGQKISWQSLRCEECEERFEPKESEGGKING